MTNKIISIVNQKGGVGKTTTAINLATALAAINQKTLIIDFDPQGNASTGCGIPHHMRSKNIYRVLIDDLPLADIILPTSIPNLFIAPSTVDLSAAEIELAGMYQREFRLKNALVRIADDFDYIIIDCPPALGNITINALTASHSLIIPLQCEFYALEGLTHLMKTIKLMRQSLNRTLDIQGVLLTMYDRRNRLCTQVEEDVRSFLGDKVYKTVIPRNVKLSEAPSHGIPAIIYDVRCLGSTAYLHLAREVIQQEGVEV